MKWKHCWRYTAEQLSITNDVHSWKLPPVCRKREEQRNWFSTLDGNWVEIFRRLSASLVPLMKTDDENMNTTLKDVKNIGRTRWYNGRSGIFILGYIVWVNRDDNFFIS